MNYYDKINWKNRSEGKTTKISAERLNHMDNQIFNNANAIGNVEKIADIGDGTLCGAAETLKETAEKLTQSLDRVQFIYSGTPKNDTDISTALNYRYILVLKQTSNQSKYYRQYYPQLIPIKFIKEMRPNPSYFITPVDVNVWYNNGLYIKTNSSSDTNRYQVYGVN